MTGRMQQSIENQLGVLAESLSECLQPSADDGTRRETRPSERQDAVKIAGATATLLQALAKLKGTYRHDYQVVRRDEPQPRLRKGWSGKEEDLLTMAEYEALDQWSKEDYCRWSEGLPPRWGGWKKQPPDDPLDELIKLRTEIDRLSKLLAPPPPPEENRGSNKDAAKS